MWYYESNHQAAGPVDETTIAELLKSGAITALTLVWKEGMPDWKHLGETELSDLARKLTSSVPQMPVRPVSPANTYSDQPSSTTTPAYGTIYSRTAYSTTGAGPRVKTAVLKNLFTWWLGFTIISMLYNVFATLVPSSAATTALDCVGSMAILMSAVLNYILLFRFWQIDQDGHASTTPGKAVGFCFIPLFNIYWMFRAFAGLSLDQNRYIGEHFGNLPEGTVKKPNVLIAFVYLIVSYLGSFILAIFMISKASAAMSTQIDQLNPETLMAGFTTPIMIFSLVTMLLNILMFLNFYRTAKSIAETEEKQNY